jgi:hypothetical protein
MTLDQGVACAIGSVAGDSCKLGVALPLTVVLAGAPFFVIFWPLPLGVVIIWR